MGSLVNSTKHLGKKLQQFYTTLQKKKKDKEKRKEMRLALTYPQIRHLKTENCNISHEY